MASRHHFKFVWLLIPGFLAGLLLATYEEARAGSGGNAAAAGAAGLAIGLIIGGMAAEQQKQQQQQGYPNCPSLHGPGAVNAASNPQRCTCRSGYTRVSEGGAWRCTPSGGNTAGTTRSIGGADRYENEKIQEALNLLGYDAGVVDGAPGEKTRQAIRRFQADRGFTQTGQLAAAEKQILFKTVEERRTALGDTRGGSGVPPTPPALPPTSPSVDSGISASDPRMELALWETVKDSKNRVELEEYVARYPGGQFTKVALRRIDQLTRDEAESRRPVESRRVLAGTLPPIDDEGYPKARQRRPDAVAVIIGNSAYKKDVPSVDYAGRDADAVKLLAIKTLGVESDNIVFRKNATRKDMDDVFGNEIDDHKGELWRKLDPAGGSDLFVFYSGHGLPSIEENADTYLLPVDGDPDRPKRSAYPVKQLMDILSKFPTRSTTVFLDACFSGKAADENATSLINSASPVFIPKGIPGNPKINAFAAAGPTQLASWDNKRGHGIFTRHLLLGLAGEADENKDKQVTAKELQVYLAKHVKRDARRDHGRDQEPSFTGKDTESLVMSSF
jgi:Caspase domain/Putative peptidoglycan binding domain